MTGAERGFALLTSALADPERRPLTSPQLRRLKGRMDAFPPENPGRDLTRGDLLHLGYGTEEAERILQLLSQEELLEYTLAQARRRGIRCLTPVTPGYPPELRRKLGWDLPGVLWAKGDMEILRMPKVAAVGSRDLLPDNRHFAAEVGVQAAKQGFALVSGNARGADRAAQEACLAAGGSLIVVVADGLTDKRERERVLYLSEEGFDREFSSMRALRRNRIIHCMGQKVFVAQCSFGTGGTWDGTTKNLKYGWTPVFLFDDGSQAAVLLCSAGAVGIAAGALSDFASLGGQTNFLYC